MIDGRRGFDKRPAGDDKPTGNLDSPAEGEMMAVLEKLNRQGKTVVLVTHSTEIADRAGNLVRVRDGQIERNQGD